MLAPARWSTLTRFEYTITRAQFISAIAALNLKTGMKFSTEPSDYELGSANVGIEGTLNDPEPPPPVVSHRPFSMGYSGSSLEVSTQY